jgi:hypothetical protein
MDGSSLGFCMAEWSRAPYTPISIPNVTEPALDCDLSEK